MNIRTLSVVALLAVHCTKNKPDDSLSVGDTSPPTESPPDDSEPTVETGDSPDSPHPDDTGPLDEDGDGWTADGDCDDGDASTHPGATGVYCDGVDHDCDGVVGVANTGGEEFSSIQEAIDSEAVDGTVQVCPGTHTEALYVNAIQAVTIESYSGSYEDTLLSGEGKQRILYVHAGAAVELSNLSLVNGRDPHDGGGAVYVYVADLTLSGCYVGDCEAQVGSRGGAVYFDAGSGGVQHLEVDSSVFENNRAGYAGAIYATSALVGLDASITGSRFVHNLGSFDGGALGINSADEAVDFDTESTVVIESTVFESNEAGWSGGAIDLFALGDLELLLSNSSFSSNASEWGGGAIYWYDWRNAVLRVEATDFQGNESHTEGGGACFLASSSDGTQEVEITDSSFDGNSAEDGTGAFYAHMTNDGTLSITDSSFTNNTSGDGVGGLSVYSAQGLQASLQQVDIVGNTTTGTTGGLKLYARGGGTLDILQGSITGNSGGDSGGVYVSSSDVTLTSTDVDWGEGATDNSPYDLVGYGEYLDDLGANETFTCDDGGCY